MSAEIEALAAKLGIAADWTDAFDAPQRVSTETLERVVTALGFECGDSDAIARSLDRLAAPKPLPPLIIGDAGQALRLGSIAADGPSTAEISLPGGPRSIPIEHTGDGATLLAPDEPGYHRLQIGAETTVIAVAAGRCPSVADLTGKSRAFGTAVQTYSLRSSDDGGIGTLDAVGEVAARLGPLGADAIAVSPMHALFAAEPGRASPYAPSTRLALNPLLAGPASVFGAAAVHRAWDKSTDETTRNGLELAGLIDWDRSGAGKLAMLRALFAALSDHDAQREDFESFRTSTPPDIVSHALFEAIHAKELAHTNNRDWHAWPAPLAGADAGALEDFARENADEISFHLFLQWITERSLAHAQRRASDAGMGVGIIADLAVGTDPSGSYAWTRGSDLLQGLTIGAPPDALGPDGQSWGLTAFSPTALEAKGFEPFLATVRAVLRHVGGVRIDHVLGFNRLWLIAAGAPATEGAYLAYPFQDFLRLLTIEAHAHRALIIGEDLGTVPPGFRDQLADSGILGMRVLPFVRDEDGSFTAPDKWDEPAIAMTSTHDLPPIAGWWHGRDIAWRARLRGETERPFSGEDERETNRAAFWTAAHTAQLTTDDEPDRVEPAAVVDAAIAYVAAARSALAIVPAEDLLGLEDAPNLPGTIDEHPNWRRRIDMSSDALSAEAVSARIVRLAGRSATG